MSLRAIVLAAALVVARAAGAQSAAEHIAMGDREHDAMHADAALHHYEEALSADPKNYEALWKASRDAVDLGEAETDATKRTALYKEAEGFARRAVEANPGDAEAHFHLARSLGRAALTLGKKDRVKYAGEVRAQALAALEKNPNHPGALHVMGVWNAEVMRLSGIERFFAKNLLGGKVFSTASWDNAVSYMERAVAADPDRIVHHLDLGEIYADVGSKAKAREQFELVAKLPAREFNDVRYKRQAEQDLAKLK